MRGSKIREDGGEIVKKGEDIKASFYHKKTERPSIFIAKRLKGSHFYHKKMERTLFFARRQKSPYGLFFLNQLGSSFCDLFSLLVHDLPSLPLTLIFLSFCNFCCCATLALLWMTMA